MENIILIEEVTNFSKPNGSGYSRYDGFKIVTDKQTILMGISNGQSCCEEWGYLMSEDTLNDFYPSKLISINIIDEEMASETLTENMPTMYEGSCMFVNIHTTKGTLQFVAYNGHNGYYGHDAILITKESSHTETL